MTGNMKEISVKTERRTALVNITREISDYVRDAGLERGVVTVFVPHTTAGVTINENADPDVMIDIDEVLDRLIPWSNGYRHMEGNTAAHVKASLMGSSVQVIVEGGRLCLGTWQGVFFCEFDGPRHRTCWISGTR
jgi:secondary thiamine-phosphate synthase enzyme